MKLLKTDVETILGDLSDREAYVLRMRFGLGGSSPSTLATVAQELRLTRERVRQIQLAAIKKLRGRSPTHEVLYSDRAVAGEKDPTSITDDWIDDDIEDDDYGGLPSPVLMDLVKQALEPSGDEMLDKGGRVVSGARRRLMREAAQAERAAVAAAAAAATALNGKDEGEGEDEASGAGEESGKKRRGFVMKRPYSKRSRPVKGEGGGDAGGDVAGTKTAPTAPPTAQRTAAWQPSLQAA